MPAFVASLHLGVGPFSPPPADCKCQPRRTNRQLTQTLLVELAARAGLWSENVFGRN